MVLVAVDHGASRELVVVLFSVQRFLDTSIIFLAFLVALAVFEKDTLFVFYPIVAVVSVQVSLIESELGQQYWVTGQLVKVVQ